MTPPQGLDVECLMMFVMRDQSWTVCADTPDDMRFAPIIFPLIICSLQDLFSAKCHWVTGMAA